MSNRVPVACPNCRATLKIRAEYLGRTLECKQCHHKFAHSPAEVMDGPLPEASIARLADEKVDIECPGCRRTLRMRPRYLGTKVVCKRCNHRFLAPPRPDEGPQNEHSKHAEGSHSERNGPEHERPDLVLQIGLLAGRLGGVEAGLAEINSERPGWVASLERSVAEWEQRRRTHASLEASLSAFRAEFEGLREKVESGSEAGRAAFDGEAAARLVGERDLAPGQLEQLRIEIEGLRQQNAELANRGSEAEARSSALESRLASLEEVARQGSALESRLSSLEEVAHQGIERETRLEERLRRLEDPEVVPGAIREEFERLRDQDRSLSCLADNHAEELRAGLAALRAEHSSIRQAIENHEERQDRLESASARLETSGLEGGRSVAALRERLETGYVVVREEIEKLHELLQQAVDHHAERHGRLEKSLDRLDAIESERTSLRHELERLRLEQQATRREALAQSEWSRSEAANLRAELERWKSSPSPVAEASKGLRSNLVDSQPVVRPSALSPFFNLDQLAQDLVLDQLGRREERSSRVGPTTTSETSSNGAGVPGRPTTAPPDVTAEYNRLGQEFARPMLRGDYVEAAATARRLVAFAREHFGFGNFEHALWLRNLGVSLSHSGIVDEARASLHLALDICQENLKSDPLPPAICMIDLAESYLTTGERRQAKSLCSQAMAILKKAGLDPENSHLVRAQDCMARIVAVDPNLPSLETTSIST